MMISGKAWIFGDNINTDLMVPSSSLYLPPDEQKRFVFSANRPGWVDAVRTGDILLAGKNFGTGSSRPAARSLRNLGVACLLAESINGLFFRNAVNFGFLALECPGIHAATAEGERVEVSIDEWQARSSNFERAFDVKPVPKPLLDFMMGGGVFPYLESQGLVGP